MSYIEKWPSFLFLFLFFGTIHAQDNLTGYWQPQFALNYDVTGIYSHNFSVANRNYIIEDSEVLLKTRQIDLVHFSTLKIKDNQSIALGIQYRFRNNFDGGDNELRLTQQYNVTSKPLSVRYGHRFRSEQRITESLTTHRFRYRFAVDFPLMGEKLDLGEPYFVGSFENLLSVAKGTSSQYDARLSGQIGWQLDHGLKLQAGVEYRMEEFTSGQPQNVVFLFTSAQLSL
ncbi:Protein of unknown function [Flagellimonas taeanensis]|uniref:DUF2490 domain-containing protein n=1 Tax=Flagellimonas taeanensis TaxID=1005926 RepID=A0A1M6PLG6_9FLAO|nr:DUF2490 domain-containing protein [Allomuricauda taeanensis]SFB67136.1 Protein of unknown function [Allomuricauda taeanensis]SHK08789.1 Protein of unknown function [Allomuricauda taeanensis]